jgi:peptidoglycan/xylan/chitin deacetylase (PgdA/CDA1 family)
MTIAPKKFERQIRWLSRHGYAGIRPSDWIAWCRSGAALPKKPVLITFDDAFAAIAEHALPVLQRYGFGAAVFIVTRKVGKTNDWERGSGRPGTDPLMTAEQIRNWAEKGIEFGAHSRNHADLTTLTGQGLADELEGSAKDLAEIVGGRIVSFAYPYGYYNLAIAERARTVFELAFTCEEGLNHLATEPSLMRRTLVTPGDLLMDLACRVRFGWSPITAVRAKLRVRSRWRSLRAKVGEAFSRRVLALNPTRSAAREQRVKVRGGT